eukprot:scaffold8835_cov24-Prasinocladus_malaysianus.AAC.2
MALWRYIGIDIKCEEMPESDIRANLSTLPAFGKSVTSVQWRISTISMPQPSGKVLMAMAIITTN